MHETIQKFKEKLMAELKEDMALPISTMTVKDIAEMIACYDLICEFCKKETESESEGYELTDKSAKAWVREMENADGSEGAKWTAEETERVRMKMDVDVKPCLWFITMNMMYSDYGMVARKYGVDSPYFYADMAKAFLFDKDGGTPEEKLAGYYEGIVDDKH